MRVYATTKLWPIRNMFVIYESGVAVTRNL